MCANSDFIEHRLFEPLGTLLCNDNSLRYGEEYYGKGVKRGGR